MTLYLVDQNENILANCGTGEWTALPVSNNGATLGYPTTEQCRSVGTGNNANYTAVLTVGWPPAVYPVDHLTVAPIGVRVTQTVNVPVNVYGPPISAVPAGELLVMPLSGSIAPAGLGTVTCSNTTSNCVVTAGPTSGTGTLTVTSGGKTTTAALSVISLDVKQVALSPTTFVGTAGYTIQLTPTATDSGGATISGALPYVWSSSNTTVATVSASGFVTSVAAGNATISASLYGVKGTTTTTTKPMSTTLSGPTEVTQVGTYSYTASAPSGCNTTCTWQWTEVSKTGTVVWNATTATQNVYLTASNGSPKVQASPVSNGIVGISPFLTIINNIGSCGTKIVC